MPRSIFHSLPSATCLRNVSYVGCFNGLLAVCILIELGRWKLSAQMVQMVFFPPFPFFLSFTFSHCIFFTRRGESPSSACGSFSSKYVAVDEPLSDWVQMISLMASPTRNGYYSYQAVIILLLILLFHFFLLLLSLFYLKMPDCAFRMSIMCYAWSRVLSFHRRILY